MSRAERKAEKKAEKEARRNAKKNKVSIEDAYDDSDRTMSDEEAHRDKVYRRPSRFSQIKTVYMIQMKRFTKQKTVWLMLLLLLALPVAGGIGLEKMAVSEYSSNAIMTVLLILMPLLSMFIVAFTCSSMLPQEFNERTVYLSLPLPMSRFTFYIGKFLSGLSLSLGIVLAAYGLSLLTASKFSVTSFPQAMLGSIPVMVCGVFFFCSLSYMFSAKSKRGAPMKTLIILLALIPGLCMAAAYLMNTNGMSDAVWVLGYVPVFSPDMALYLLGPQDPMFPNASLYGLVTMMGFAGPGTVIPLTLGSDVMLMCTVSLILGIVALIIGYKRIARRDM